jgi:hypothetical protein
MKQKLEEARDILSGILERSRRSPVGLIRAHRLLEQVLADWWDEDHVAILAPNVDDELVGELTDEPPFPAA